VDETSRGSSCGLRLLLQGELVDVDVADPKRLGAPGQVFLVALVDLFGLPPHARAQPSDFCRALDYALLMTRSRLRFGSTHPRSVMRSVSEQASFLLGELLLGEDPGVAQGGQFA
jgi:hypothetical protein